MVFTGISRASAITKASNNWLNPLPLRAQGDAGHGGVDEGLVLEEPQVFPSSGPCVVNRLIRRPTGRAGKPAPRLEANVKVDFLELGVKAHVRDTPWGLQAKRHREQACLGSHRSSMSAGLRKPYSASEQGAGQQMRRVRRCDLYGLRARRASRYDHNIW
jgi:hypothetical protein